MSKSSSEVEIWIKKNESSLHVLPGDNLSESGEHLHDEGSVCSSTTSSAKLRIRARKAELEAKQRKLEERHRLKEENIRLQNRMEMLEIEAEIEGENAQMNIYEQFEEETFKKTEDNRQFNPRAEAFRPNQSIPNSQSPTYQHDIIGMLIENQKQASLPQRQIPVFRGDPLQYKNFISAFQNNIERKTSSPIDRLYYLDQFTSGQANDLVQSCLHMDPFVGYPRARSLLEKQFGNKFKLATAYIDKALQWPEIKSEDREGLSNFAIFLTTCSNIMESVDYMTELNHPKNLRDLVSKLPYKLRERFRTITCNIQEERIVRFSDLVSFVDNQSKILSNPIFGTIVQNKPSSKPQGKETPQKIHKNFATNVDQKKAESVDHQKSERTPRAFRKPCWHCKGDHTMSQCRQLQRKSLTEKIDFLRPKGICFRCLDHGHMSKDCQQRQQCKICRSNHATIFHDNDKDASEKRERRNNEKQSIAEVTNNSLAANEDRGKVEQVSCMPVVPVRIKVNSSDKYVNTYAFLDSGSSATFCSRKLAEELRIVGKKTKIVVSTMNQKKIVDTTVLEGLQVGNLTEETWVDLPTVFTQDKMPISKSTIPKEEFVHQWPHLRNVSLPPIDADIGLLIGNNAPKASEPVEVINSNGEGPYAVRTALGWIVNGLTQEAEINEDRISVNRIDVLEDARLNVQLEQFINREFSERSSDDHPQMSTEDKKFLKNAEATIHFRDGHYEMALPFRDSQIKLPNNRLAAEQRCISLKRKFKKNPDFYEDYATFMKDILDHGYAQKVPDDKLDRDDGKLWYIPHHGVYHPKKPEKIRVVFDCAAQYKGQSINDHLLQGPDLTNNLLGVLIRFRQYPIALMADIESMFYQVKVKEEDYDVLRFLWWPEGNLEEALQEYQMKVHIFGATSSPSCANFALRQAAKDNKDQVSKEAVLNVKKSFYVDDCLSSVNNEEEAIGLSRDLMKICRLGGFRLTKWISNNRQVLNSIPEEDRAKDVKSLDLDQDALPVERALGVHWCVESDKFSFRVNVKEKPATRRGILSVTSSIYDPLGFVSPFVLKAKSILQDLCRIKIGWDDTIPEDKKKEWNKWLSELPRLDELEIERCLQPRNDDIASTQVHHFSDASETGYGIVSYLRQIRNNGQIHCAFLISKSRVAPLKQITIPRLELSAATLAVRVDKTLKRELDIEINETYFWTDSMSVLRYINNKTRRFQTFVANRLTVIHEGSTPSQWRYVDTSNNPADEASRGLSLDKFLKDTRWFSGPDFLQEAEDKWPQTDQMPMLISKDDKEVKKAAAVNAINCQQVNTPTEQLINYYSDWFVLRKAVGWILRIKQMLVTKIRKQKTPEEKNPPYLTIKDIQNSEIAILKFVQQISFEDEIREVNFNIGKIKKNSRIRKLDPYLEDSLLRVGGRLNHSNMPESSKHPVILPADSHVSKLIIRATHNDSGHSGRNHVLSELSEKYWIIKANSAVRKVIRQCVKCRRSNAAVNTQKMADLPWDRVRPDDPPFTYVGVDYFGPFELKQRRSRVKRYGVLFTCLTTRAVHIEVSNSLDTDSCINAIRRFVARRGQVKVIRSDNGTNFVGTEKELKNEIQNWNAKQIQQEMLRRNIEWVFNPPAASHHGGVWERQIRTVRKLLRSVLREQTLDEESMQTVLCEIESIINNRPISRVSSDHGDLEALTPNHLLLLKRQPNLPPAVADDNYPRRRWRQVQYMADLFWKRWVKEYLPLLQERQKWVTLKRNLKTGDIVLVADHNAPRNTWCMGRIIEVRPDKKGHVRSVKLKTGTSTLERPINKLCLLLESEL